MSARELQLKDRCLAAALASTAAAIIVSPLDIVKTRMQAQAAAAGMQVTPISLATLNMQTGGLASITSAPGNLWAGAELPVILQENQKYRSTLGGMSQIARTEGLSALWRGINVSLLISVPNIVLYLPLYDQLLKDFAGLGTLAPFLAGSVARGASVVCTSPLELLRTRIQASSSKQQPGNAAPAAAADSKAKPKERHVRQAVQQLRSETQGTLPQRVTSLWRGVGATLAKDVPFAGLYWTLMEPTRSWLTRHVTSNGVVSPAQDLAINATAGSSAGALAAAITTPFDVLKTRIQTSGDGKKTMLACARGLMATGGVTALFSGVGPRTLRTTAAYGILMSSYELCKWFVGGSATFSNMFNLPSPVVDGIEP